MVESNLNSLIKMAKDSSDKALADLTEVTKAVVEARTQLLISLKEAQKAAGLAEFDSVLVQEFLDRPYLVRPLGDNQYELAIPKFMPFTAGWPIKHEGAYKVYLVTRFTHFMDPLPQWLADELEFGAPTFAGQLDITGNILRITSGNVDEIYDKLGGSKTIFLKKGDELHLKPKSRIDILRQIIRDEGFLPYTVKPIPKDLLREPLIAETDDGKPAFVLRPHQQRDYERFLETGAISIFAYPQTGKSYVVLQALASLKGRKLILSPRKPLVAQWEARLEMYLTEEAAAEVVVTTYQSAHKFFDQEWTLIIPDEAHHMPAPFAIESATRIQTVARIGLSATPRREDGNEDLIPLLCGFPVGYDWPVSYSQRPSVNVWLVKDDAQKLKVLKQLCAKPIEGKTFIFTYLLDIGRAAAEALDVPFVYSRTKDPLSVMEDNDTVVVSKVADEGLSFPVRRGIELNFLFGSKMEAGQRLGRLAYEIEGQDIPGEHHVLMTREEFDRYHKRLFIYEQWGLEINLCQLDSSGNEKLKKHPVLKSKRSYSRPKPVTSTATQKSKSKLTAEQNELMELFKVKIEQAEESLPATPRPYVRILFPLYLESAFTPNEIADGLSIKSKAIRSYYRSATKVMLKVGILVEREGGRYIVDQEEINRLRALRSKLRR